MIDLNKLPKELTENRDVVECNFVLSLYKQSDLMSDYSNVENGEDIITKDGMFYYGLAVNMNKAGYKTFDNMGIYEYLSDKKVLMDGFESRGGYQTIKDIEELLSVENIEVYYEELVKSNLLIRLYNSGFNVLDKLDKLKKMNSEQIYDYYEYQLANISIGKIEKIKIEDLSTGYDKWIEKADSGTDVGFRVGSPLLNYQLAGVHKDNLMLYLGGIGQGKSSTAVNLFILSAIQNGENVCVICNEQTADEYRNMIMSAVLFGKIKTPKGSGMNRMKLTIGNFTEEQKDLLKTASDWISKQKGRISFVALNNYDIASVRKIITRQSKLGVGLFFFDTLKSVSDADANSWGLLSDVAKELFMLAKQQHVAIIASAQLASDSMYRKFLDLSSVGKSRAISEVATSVVGFRPIMNDEIDKIKPFTYSKESSKIKIEHTLDPDEHYIMMFVMKNRFGNINPQIVMKFNQNFNTLEDVGYWNQGYDNFSRR